MTSKKSLSARCPRCGEVFSLGESKYRTIYCSARCREYTRNRRYFLKHKEEKRVYNREQKRRRRLESTPIPYVNTACLPVFC